MARCTVLTGVTVPALPLSGLCHELTVPLGAVSRDCCRDPAPVAAVLHQATEFRGMELIEGFFEKETDLRCCGRPSQTDLLALIGDGEAFALLGIEGKVNEPFGALVSEWLADASTNKRARLSILQNTLGLVDRDISNLRYQLLHRTAAVIYEAQRYKVRRAGTMARERAAANRAPRAS